MVIFLSLNNNISNKKYIKKASLDIIRIIAAFLVFIPHLILNFSNNLTILILLMLFLQLV